MIRIDIIDDHAMVRTGLKQRPCAEVDFRATARVSPGREALDLVRGGDMLLAIGAAGAPGFGAGLRMARAGPGD